MCVTFHINDILNDSWKFLMQVYEKSYNRCVFITKTNHL